MRSLSIPRPRIHAPHLRPSREAVAGEVLYRGTRALMGLTRLRSYGRDEVLEWKRQGRPVIFVGWHGHDVVNLGAFHPVFGPEARGAIMVRDNPDGMALEHFARRMKISVVSLGPDLESPQGARGVVRMIKLIRGGCDALLAVDGPDGPAYQVKPGAALIAQRAGAILVPAAVACTRALRMRGRWDEQLVPLPLSRTVVYLGPGIDAQPPGGPSPSLEELRERIGVALAEGVRQAEALCRT